MDTSPPEIVDCLRHVTETIDLGEERKRIYWPEPKALDKSGNVSLIFQSHQSGSYFSIGSTDVSYLFSDGFGNVAYCNFTISLTTGKIEVNILFVDG